MNTSIMKKFLFLALIFSTTLIYAQNNANKSTYVVDGGHSSLVFSVGYQLSDFYGSFGQMEGKVTFDNEDDFSSAAVDFTVKIASINTNSKTRDGHLQGERYFNAEKAPTASFKSNYIKPIGDNMYEMTGDLTIGGITLAQTVKVEVKGKKEIAEKDGSTTSIMGVKAIFSFNRSNFGIKGGLPTITDKVDITASLSLVKE